MSRTWKRPDWLKHDTKPHWRGKCQAIRENLRTKIQDRRDYDRDSDNHAATLGIAICGLFAKGYSLEYIRKRLVGKWPANVVDGYIAQTITRKAYWGYQGDRLKVSMELVCVSDEGYLIPLATADCDPHLLIDLPIPIYYTRTTTYITKHNRTMYDNGWRSGKIVLMDGKLHKFTTRRNKKKGNCADVHEDDLTKQKLELWPNEHLTEILSEVAAVFFDKGMRFSKFEVMGWSGLSYKIDIVE